MSDYGKGSRRCPEDWRKVHRNWPFGKKRPAARGMSTDALLRKLRTLPEDVREVRVIDICGYPTPVVKAKPGVHRYVRKEFGI